MEENEEYCTNCNKKLDPDKVVWLELHWQKLTYHIPGTLSEEDSQGCFPFGRDCAKRILKNDQ